MEKKIIIKNQITLWQFISFSVVVLAISIAVLYMLYTQDYLSYRTRGHGWEFLGFVFFILPLLFYSLRNKKEYLSEIHILSNKIELIYKIRNKISFVKTIEKENIKSFNIDAKIDLIKNGKWANEYNNESLENINLWIDACIF